MIADKEIVDPSVFKSCTLECQELLAKNGKLTHAECLGSFEKFESAVATVKKNFTGALDGDTLHALAVKELVKHGITAENTLFAQSVCPDEINHECGDVTNLFQEHLGEVFHLGGLAGLPFTGKTGFAAFSHHVPDDGNLFILIGSHIGISESFQLGKFSRLGQDRDGTACGAAVGALNYCCDKNNKTPSAEDLGANPDDYQMKFLISELMDKVDVINAAGDENARQAELAKQTYEVAQKFLDSIVTTEFAVSGKHGKLIILGGVQINMPRPMPDYFMPIRFEIRQHGQDTIDMMADAFKTA